MRNKKIIKEEYFFLKNNEINSNSHWEVKTNKLSKFLNKTLNEEDLKYSNGSDIFFNTCYRYDIGSFSHRNNSWLNYIFDGFYKDIKTTLYLPNNPDLGLKFTYQTENNNIKHIYAKLFMNNSDISSTCAPNNSKLCQEMMNKFYSEETRKVLEAIANTNKEQLANVDINLPNLKNSSIKEITDIYDFAIRKLTTYGKKQNELRIVMPIDIYNKIKKDKKTLTLRKNNEECELGYIANYNGVIPVIVVWNYWFRRNKIQDKDWLGFIVWNKAFSTLIFPYKCDTLENGILICSILQQTTKDGKVLELQELNPKSLIRFISN